MKNIHIGLFTAGIIVGGVVMLIVLAFSQIPNIFPSRQAATLPPTIDHLPHLVALEPTNVQREATPTTASPTVTATPTRVSVQATVSSTATPLLLRYEQQSDIIGYSVAGRPLEVYTFGSGEQERMIVAGIHGGDEWNTITLANQLIQYLNEDSHMIPKGVKLYILPNLNPDGEARAHNKYGHVNQRGVDLNRNFPINWQKDWDRAGCWNYTPTSGGTGPGSEVETQALMNFISRRHIQALISYHSAALGVFPGGLPPDESSTRLAKSIAAVSSYPYPPLDTGCTYSGTLADYATSLGSAAVDLELTNHIETDFDQNLQILDVLLNFAP